MEIGMNDGILIDFRLFWFSSLVNLKSGWGGGLISSVGGLSHPWHPPGYATTIKIFWIEFLFYIDLLVAFFLPNVMGF